ncbi:hypothetical protein IC582_018149 [Cucumis melo]|uniref:Encoded peptide n=2 Tax=Cucumis melo TaxID=3656 RepID=A0A5D3CLS2_CUCMM|nr:hypothetical protein E5676_scaffold255G004910 [Cucumis melo var. makuwa]
MASTKLSFAFLFISLLILCHLIDPAFSRPLTTHTDHQQLSNTLPTNPHFQFHGHTVHEGKASNNDAVSTPNPNPPTAAAGSTPGRKMDDFRPTTPGHSPGVGHSIKN